MALFAHNSDIGYSYIYDGIKSFKTIFTEMKERSTVLFDVPGGSPIANEIGYPPSELFGATIFAWKISGWRGGAISIPLSGWANSPICIAEIDGAANNFNWKKLVTANDLDKNSIVLELLNGFQSLDDAFMPLTVKKAAGLTIIIGHFKAGTTLNNWTSITSLPSGYRPTKQLRIFHSIGTDKGYGILIGVDGSVQIYNATSISEGDMLSINVAY